MDDITEKFRTRWKRWLGNKTRCDKPTWVTLLDANWIGWVSWVFDENDIPYRPVDISNTNREEVKELWLTAINHANMSALRKLDGIYATEKYEKRFH